MNIAASLYALCSEARQHGQQMIDIASLEELLYQELIKGKKERQTSQSLPR
jgi:hypothetical protein